MASLKKIVKPGTVFCNAPCLVQHQIFIELSDNPFNSNPNKQNLLIKHKHMCCI